MFSLQVLVLLTISTVFAVGDELAQSSLDETAPNELFSNIPDSVRIEQYPYHVSIEYQNTHACGGAIVTLWHIITTAHCAKKNFVRVRVGASVTNWRGITVEVKKITLHPNFNPSTSEYDAAILTLKKPLKESKYVGRVKFPTDIPIHGKFLNYTGYGVTQAATTNYRRLQKLRFQVKDPRACSRDHQMYVTEDKLCAIHWSARNRCWGNLGDLLVYEGKLYGLLSYNRACNSKYRPLVFTSIVKLTGFLQTSAVL